MGGACFYKYAEWMIIRNKNESSEKKMKLSVYFLFIITGVASYNIPNKKKPLKGFEALNAKLLQV